jgi:hypothetical protein
MAEQWLYFLEGRRVGPVAREELIRLLLSGDVPITALVWRRGLAEWVPAAAVPDLASELPPADPRTAGSSDPPSRGFFSKCANCAGASVVLRHRDQAARAFCSAECLAWFNGPRGFCASCAQETTDEPSGPLQMTNGYGRRFLGRSHECSVCGSSIRRLSFKALFIVPVLRYDFYRVIDCAPDRFISRKVTDEARKRLGL